MKHTQPHMPDDQRVSRRGCIIVALVLLGMWALIIYMVAAIIG